MSPQQVFGIAFVVVGAVLLVLGFNATQAPLGAVSEALTGTYPDRTIWLLAGGGAALVVGLLLTLGRRLR